MFELFVFCKQNASKLESMNNSRVAILTWLIYPVGYMAYLMANLPQLGCLAQKRNDHSLKSQHSTALSTISPVIERLLMAPIDIPVVIIVFKST